MTEPSPPDPDPALGRRRLPWFRLGAILPESVRTRVFAPAYYDLLAETRHRPPSAWLGIRVFGLLLESFRVGTPGLLWASRKFRKTVVAVVVVMLLAAAAYTMRADYQNQAPGVPGQLG